MAPHSGATLGPFCRAESGPSPISGGAPSTQAPTSRQLAARVQPVSLVVQITSSLEGLSWIQGCQQRTKTPRAAWTTAFGGPDEPDVKYISAGVSAGISAVGGIGRGVSTIDCRSSHPGTLPS